MKDNISCVSTDDLPFSADDLPFSTDDLPFSTDDLPFFTKIHFIYHALKQKMLERHKIKSYDRAEVKVYAL